jgi:hypothetical protein
MKAPVLVSLCALATCVAACASPETTRTRGGGAGADPGNHGAVVQLHGGARIYYKTPCRTSKVKCSGPLPSTGT